jgi:ABC-type glycerol-3-phosphate transport system substrate-binding protein
MNFRQIVARHSGVKAAGVLAVAIAVVVAGCGTGTGSGTDSASAKSSGATLTFWHYFTDRTDLMESLAATYQKQTGVKVKMVLISSGDTLGQKFQAAAQAKTLPDISAAWTGVGDKLAPYAKQGMIMNLKGELDGPEWSKNLTSSEIQTVSFAPGNAFGVPAGPYLVPLDSNNMQFLYNKKLFAKAGISAPPTTFAEFLADGKKLAATGVAPFVTGLGSWPIDSLASIYMWNMLGQAELEATFAKKEAYTSQHWVDFLALFAQLRDANVLAKGVLAMDLPAAESLFAHGQAGMIFDGSWAIGVLKQQDASFTDYGVFFPPTAGQFPVKIPGGVGAQAFVVGTSPHKQEAAKFLKWLTDAPQQATYANGSSNLPANPTVAEAQSLTPNLKAFSSKMDSLIPTLAVTMSPAVDTTMQKGIQQILAGTKTPAQVAGLMQKAQQTGQVQ